jgi:hypothetical protein
VASRLVLTSWCVHVGVRDSDIAGEGLNWSMSSSLFEANDSGIPLYHESYNLERFRLTYGGSYKYRSLGPTHRNSCPEGPVWDPGPFQTAPPRDSDAVNPLSII